LSHPNVSKGELDLIRFRSEELVSLGIDDKYFDFKSFTTLMNQLGFENYV